MTVDQAIIGGTVGFCTLALSIITMFIKASNQIALARQENEFAIKRVEKLESRVDELEDKLFAKLETIQSSIEGIKVDIAKLQK